MLRKGPVSGGRVNCKYSLLGRRIILYIKNIPNVREEIVPLIMLGGGGVVLANKPENLALVLGSTEWETDLSVSIIYHPPHTHIHTQGDYK